MNTYKEAFVFYEDSELHPEIQEVAELEIKMQGIYKELKKTLNDETLYQLDALVGEIARAYEMQGFAFAQNVQGFKATDEAIRAEEIRIQQEKTVKKTNAKGEKNVPCRLVTYDGVTKKIGDWVKFLGCGSGTFYTHFNRGGKDFDNFMRKRLAMVNV